MAYVWHWQAREEAAEYEAYRRRSNDTAYLGSNIGRRQDHTVSRIPYTPYSKPDIIIYMSRNLLQHFIT